LRAVEQVLYDRNAINVSHVFGFLGKPDEYGHGGSNAFDWFWSSIDLFNVNAWR
jgi:hypothetical protein